MASYLIDPVTQRRFSEQSITSGGGTGGNVLGPGVLARVATSVGALTVKAPPSPAENTTFAVRDVDGAAPSSPITVDGNGALIDGATSAMIWQAHGEAVFVFDGGHWRRTIPQRSFGLEGVGPVERYRDVYSPPFGIAQPFTLPPPSSAFTLRQTAANGALSDQGSTLFLQASQRVTTNDRILAVRPIPGAAYTLTVAMQLQARGNGTGLANYSIAGVATSRSGGTELEYITMYSDSGNLAYQKGSAASLVAAASVNNSGGFNVANNGGGVVWLRIQDDGAVVGPTNMTYSYSLDGLNFWRLYQNARAAAWDQAGFYVDAFNAPTAARIFSFSLTSP